MKLWDKKEDPRSLAAEGIEVWANAHGYLVSNLGQVFNPETGVLLSGHLGPKGYVSVGGRHVHRLVCSAFCGPSSHVVDHIDGNHSNNRLSNLEYVTREENSRRAVNNGQMRDRNGKVVHPLRADAAAILQKVLNGELSPKEAERLLGRSPVWIYREGSSAKMERLYRPSSFFRGPKDSAVRRSRREGNLLAPMAAASRVRG